MPAKPQNTGGLSIYELAARNAGADAVPEAAPHQNVSNQVQNDDGNRVECHICERKFNPEVIDRHMKICAKN